MPGIAANRRHLVTTPGQGIQNPSNSTVGTSPINPFTSTPWTLGGVYSTTSAQSITASGSAETLPLTFTVQLTTFPTPIQLSASTTGYVLAAVTLASPPAPLVYVYTPQVKLICPQGSFATSSNATTATFILKNNTTYTNPTLQITTWVNIPSGVSGVVNLNFTIWAMLVGQSQQTNVVT